MKSFMEYSERNDDFYMAVAEMAMDMFNRQMGTDFSHENVEVCLITEEDADEKIPAFLENYKESIEPEMLIPGYVCTICAEAFVTGERKGVLIRTDLGLHDMEWRHTFLHELSHIFCTLNELDNQEEFYSKYCIDYAGSTIQDGAINAGYAIWREFISEFLATVLDEDMLDNHLAQMYEHCDFMLNEIESMVDDDKMCVAAILVDLMTSIEVFETENSEQLKEVLAAYDRILASKSLMKLVQIVFEHIKFEELWVIDVDFIESIGNAFLSFKTELMAKKMGINYDV